MASGDISERTFIFSNFGQSSKCEPIPATSAKEGVIHWAWCPIFSLVWALWIGLVIVLLLSIFCMALGGPVGVAFGLLVAIPVLGAMWALANWQWNTNKQYKISMARGKRLDALDLWSKITEADKFRAKDVFFETWYGGKRLVVLRDGTIESYGSHKIETLEEGEDENEGGNIESHGSHKIETLEKGEGENGSYESDKIETLEKGEGENGEEHEQSKEIDKADNMDEMDDTEVSTSILETGAGENGSHGTLEEGEGKNGEEHEQSKEKANNMEETDETKVSTRIYNV